MESKDNQEKKEVKKSKLTAMISQNNGNVGGQQISVYYSDNNWKTCDEINIIIDDNTTINQLIDSSIYKFKNELSYDNLDAKHFNLMLFKKSKKRPNDDYPICNPESIVKDVGKTQFCLVEDITTKENAKNEEKNEKKEIIKNENKDISKNEKKDIGQKEKKDVKNEKNTNNKKKEQSNNNKRDGKDKNCIII